MAVLLTANHINMGLIGPDTWSSTRYDVGFDGSVEIAISHGHGKMKKSRVSTVKMGDHELIRLNDLCLKAQKEHIKSDSLKICDGEAWRFESFSKTGRPGFKFNGYLGSSQTIKDIVDILIWAESRIKED